MAAIIEDNTDTDWQDHAFLEPVAVIGFFDEEDMITVISPTQNPFSVDMWAQMLSLELDDVRFNKRRLAVPSAVRMISFIRPVHR